LRDWVLTLAACASGCACSKDAAPPVPNQAQAHTATRTGAQPTTGSAAAAAGDARRPRAYPDLAAALTDLIPPDARVVGFGELHARTDRAAATSTLASFTRALPAIADRVSDLVLETWLVDPACGKTAVQATARLETAVKRPEATRSDIATLVDAARAAHIQPHAMTLTCADYAAIAPPGGDVDAAAMLTLTTRELRRIATSAVDHRDREPGHRPWIAVYGGALHNDRFPEASVAEWSYAGDVDRATAGHFVEIDLVVPALAEADAASRREPWFGLIGAPREPGKPVAVWTRGERSFVVILP
jgi:hypothetical protein